MKALHGITLTAGLLTLAALCAPGARAQSPAFGAPPRFLPSGAPVPEPPTSGDTFYLDWVSPLQAPRGLALPAGPDESAGADLPPGPATPPLPFQNSARGHVPAPAAVPEPDSAALLAIGLLPAAAFLRRRR